MNSLHSITCILLMSLCNVEWIQTRRDVVVLEGDELAEMLFNSTKPSDPYYCEDDLLDLSITENNIDRISKDSFGNLTKLCYINLESNKIKEVDQDAFSDFVKLEEVRLNKNDIKIIQSDLFKYNHRIKNLFLSHNRISVIEKDAFKNLIQMRHLMLSANPLKQLESDIFNNNNELDQLFLSNIQLKEVNEKLFHHLVELNFLDLSDNAIVNISENLFKNNIKLQVIHLNGNRITHVQKGMFHNVKEVYFLNLENNNISELNEECFNNMPRLTYLLLDNNKIESIPQNLFIKNSDLKTLDINNNTIKNLPKGMFKHNGELRELSLNHNQLSEITSENFQMAKILWELNMANNKINRLDATSFDNTQLIHLDLQFNEIEDLPIEIFHKVNYSLKVLLLNNNKLQTIQEKVFSVGMVSLIKLNLGDNKIIDCRFFKFKYFPVLTDLYLNNNKLRDVNNILNDGFEYEIRLQNLFLEFNEIELDGKPVCKQLLELKHVNLSNNKITRLILALISRHFNSLIVDVRNNRILEVKGEYRYEIQFSPGELYLWESVIPITSVSQIESIKYYGHEKIFKLKQMYLSVSAVLREIEEIICEDDLIIVSLEIHRNHLQRIDCLSEVWTLHFIDFSYNKLTTLKKKHFSKMIHLETLDISLNQLTSLDLKVFAASVKLTEFYFDRCEVVYSWQYYRITEMFPNLTHISMQNNTIYCPLLSTIIQKFQNSNITIRDYKRDVSIVFDSIHGISCEDYQSLKEILILIMYSMNFLITTVIIIVLSIIHHRDNIRIK